MLMCWSFRFFCLRVSPFLVLARHPLMLLHEGACCFCAGVYLCILFEKFVSPALEDLLIRCESLLLQTTVLEGLLLLCQGVSCLLVRISVAPVHDCRMSNGI